MNDAETRKAVANIVRDLAIDLIASRIDELEIADRIIARLTELGWHQRRIIFTDCPCGARNVVDCAPPKPEAT